MNAQGSEPRRLKILDFGIAKALSENDRKALGLIAPTTEGAIMGTPSSVSPEQVQSGKIDARTDIYGLGVVLFRLVAGRPPFVGDALQLFRAHLLEPAPRASTISCPASPSRPATAALSTIAPPSKLGLKWPWRTCGRPLSSGRPSAFHFRRPPSRIAT